MARFIWVIAVSFPLIVYYILRAEYIVHHEHRYSEDYRYKVARKMVRLMKRNAFIRTKVYGNDNLPKEGGYILYPNHQGKYDAIGIIGGHEKPCTVVIDEERSHIILADQFIKLINGARLDRKDYRSQVNIFRRVKEEVKKGRRYIIFAEGGYNKNRNNVREFLPGAFKCAVEAKSPIVPVALIDSYYPFEVNSLKPVTTQVHFLSPIYYDDYKEMTTKEIALVVRDRIAEAVEAYS